ncbi:hypothetical protein TR2A62_0649 [Thalassobium sp. R2A62]|nr:hypothetical protein TR2A62_0649 [Thalassobium sp. R2A62]
MIWSVAVGCLLTACGPARLAGQAAVGTGKVIVGTADVVL